MKYVIRSLNKDGSVSKMKLTSYAKIYHVFNNPLSAIAKREQLEFQNPNHKFFVSEEEI